MVDKPSNGGYTFEMGDPVTRKNGQEERNLAVGN